MRCDNVKVTLSIPVPIDKPDGNSVIYSEDAIRKACEKANGTPIIRFDDNGNEIPIGVANKVEYSNGFIWVDAVAFHGGTNELVEMLDNKKVTSMEIKGFSIGE